MDSIPAPILQVPVAGLPSIPAGRTGGKIETQELLLEEAHQMILKQFPKMRSFLVVREGQLIWERYYNGHTASSLNDLRSATKSFTSTLIGIGMNRGDLPGPDTHVKSLLACYAPQREDPLLERVTLHHLLTMTAGFYWKTGKKLGEAFIPRFHRSRSWARFAMRLPVQEEMFGRFQYRSTDSHLLSAVLSESTGKDAYSYARAHLFEPLGISHVAWPSSPDGHTMGHVGLALTSRDLAKFALCCLDGGRWEGQPLIPTAWLKTAHAVHAEGYPAFGNYGYQWWTGRINEADFVCAHGHGGQQVYLLPGQNAAVIFTADSKVSRWKNPRSLLQRYILPAMQ
ncbi:serine hydrolase [Paenibacillus sp. JX-17]|uniref:Serine hydrolase n=1 Tax=Paenibacillus lacisoli TaxID=3064525 RepID=A0ABT9CBL3_9BACL|nr:serine hydrolase [Paenibacillus sp. JX-17]MDO7906645.1 serine hydrolase [Paenibacillus sp. JX-17]